MANKKNVKEMKKKWKIAKGNAFGTALGVGGCILWMPFLIALIMTVPDEVIKLISNQPLLELSSIGIYTLFFGMGTLMSVKGTRMKKQIRRYERYNNFIGEQTTVALEELAQITHKSVKYISKDLHKMIEQNLFSDAYIDQGHRQLIFGNEQYIASVNQKTVIEIEPARSGDSQVDQTIDEGTAHLKQIKHIQSRIENEVIVAKIERISQLTGNIFNVVIENPSKITEIRRFMQYYLPTTLKLLNAYEKFLTQDIQGDNISQAITYIEGMLETIIEAFEKLLDNLFQAEALDIMTDITVLEGLLAQEGLTEQHFK